MTAIQIATHPDLGCLPANSLRPQTPAAGRGGLCFAAEKEEEEGLVNAYTISRPKGAGGAAGEVYSDPSGGLEPVGQPA